MVSRSLPLAALTSSIAAMLLSGCVPPPPVSPTAPRSPAPAPAPRPRPSAPAAPPASDWRDAPMTPGDWSYGATAGGSVASFGGVFTLRCAPQAGTITLTRAATPRSTPVSMTVTTSDGSRAFTGRITSAGIEIALPARDKVLDSMAFSRGRFAIAAPGETTLYIPSWTEVTRVIEDCR
ncbi:hypothetical protein V474_11770 [Novosphingobium barchaimii LL02]|uniref:Lipoprotein n=1 Tax=Novosphingobium barchaimii LL02 TaxID=1114963 RepID=A0A0J7Y7Q7_9SPHN|nr:hypothetical protein V474_11770 [Novosphingobium barchaimii LL02]